MPPRLTVIGGTGFVGTRVVKAALAQGLQVTSVSRSGKLLREDPALAGAEFVAADVEDEASLRTVLDGADSVVSCLGAFGSQDFMRRINGDANASIAKHARAVGVKRMVYVSAQPFRPIEGLLHGYFGGKRAAEEAVAEHFGSDGAILRPPAVYGTRAVSATASVPLGALGVPLTTFLETGPMRGVASALGPLGDFLTPWVSVDDVAHAAVAHVVADAPAADGVATEPSSAPAAAAAAYNDQLRLQRPAGEPLMLRWTEIREAARRLRTAMPPEVTLFWDGGCPLCRCARAEGSALLAPSPPAQLAPHVRAPRPPFTGARSSIT